MAHLVLGAHVQCPVQKYLGLLPKDTIHFICEKLGVHHKLWCAHPERVGRMGKASALAGSRNLRQTQDFSAFHPIKPFFGLSDTLCCLADQDLGTQGTEFRPFKNVGILINNPEDLPMGGKHSVARFPQKQNISWSRLSTRGTNKVSKAETLDMHTSHCGHGARVPPRPLSSPAQHRAALATVLGAVHRLLQGSHTGSCLQALPHASGEPGRPCPALLFQPYC